MDAGYKHFTHVHNLTMHQEHNQPPKWPCSGCKLLVTGTMYVCWQCNFILHEQCFRATRSLKHPLHPSHPLSLFPYPTYPSNSFCCNSCKLAGTGLSYSCPDCEFDLHVHCAHSNVNGQEKKSSQDVPNSYKAQNAYNHHTSAQNSNYNSNPSTNPQYSSMGPNSRRAEESDLLSDLECINLSQQMLEAVRVGHQMRAKGRNYILGRYD